MNAASILRSKVVAVAGAGSLALGLLGGVAWAATPTTTDAVSLTVPDTQNVIADGDRDKAHAKLKAALDALVAKGVITQGQEDAIVAALAADHADRPKLREFVGDVFKASTEYIGLPADAVKAQLHAGKSLGQIAGEQPGKSRDGLIAVLDAAAGKRIDAAVDAGKLTKAQADELRTKVQAAIVKIVDHAGTPRPDAKGGARAKPTPKPTN